jgi:biotin-(acetyl-CoA carboxylase) ligase
MFDQIMDGDTASLRNRWMKFGPTIGMRVVRRDSEQEICGAFAGLGEQGQLILRDDSGELSEVLSGDIEYL